MRSVALLTDPDDTQLSPGGLAELFRAGRVDATHFDVSRWREPLELGLNEWWDRDVLRHDRIIVAGGDETVGLAARVAAEASLPLAVIPGGDGEANEFARERGIPVDIVGSAALAVGPTTRSTRLATVGHLTFVEQASLVAPWFFGRKPFPCRVRIDGAEIHDGETIALQVLPPPKEEPDGELIARLTVAGADDHDERRCSMLEVELPPDRPLTVDGTAVPAGSVADGATLRFAVTKPFELVVPE